MKYFITLLATACLAISAFAEDLSAKLQNIALTIHAGRSQGSGVLFTRDKVNFVLTAGHVVEGLRSVITVLDNGREKKIVKFSPVNVVKEIYEDSKSVGITSVQADVVAYSSPNYGHDLALLKLRSKISDSSADFYQDVIPPVIGTELIHVGSLLGQDGSNSVTTGIYSQVGRVLFDKVFDQTTCTAFPGSSGGGVYLKSNGQYVGTLVRGAGETFNLIVPVRRIKQWAEVHKVSFLFDPTKKVNEKEIKLEGEEPVGESSSNKEEN